MATRQGESARAVSVARLVSFSTAGSSSVKKQPATPSFDGGTGK